MPIIEKKVNKNYLLCFQNENGKIYSSESIRKSWENRIKYVTENLEKGIGGLRDAQLGAIFSIRAHWIVSNSVATKLCLLEQEKQKR